MPCPSTKKQAGKGKRITHTFSCSGPPDVIPTFPVTMCHNCRLAHRGLQDRIFNQCCGAAWFLYAAPRSGQKKIKAATALYTLITDQTKCPKVDPSVELCISLLKEPEPNLVLEPHPRCGSGSTKMMRLPSALAPNQQLWLKCNCF
jgi:hypothetical protein